MGLVLPDTPGYVVKKVLGQGGMGIVYLARREATGTVVALKMILCGRGATFQELVRFRIEAEAMACLNHPNILNILDVGIYSGYPFLALEYAEKGTLKQVIDGRPQPVRWSAELVRTLALAMQHAHERGMLHRDLKPANILVMGDGTPKVSDFGLVKFAAPMSKVSEACCTLPAVSFLDRELIRFARELGAQYKSISDVTGASEEGRIRSAWQECAMRTGGLEDAGKVESVRAFVEKATREAKGTPDPFLNDDDEFFDDDEDDGLADVNPFFSKLTRSGAIMGSPSYMAPEQATGALQRIGPHTDVYALGGILYELLTGQPAFRAASLTELFTQVISSTPTPLRQIEPRISPELEAICLKCLEKSPDSRYRSATAFADALTSFLESSPPVAAGNELRADALPSTISEEQAVPSTPSEKTVSEPARPVTTWSWWPFGKRGSKAKGSGK
jgi:serine/threonine protein kinase